MDKRKAALMFLRTENALAIRTIRRSQEVTL